MVADGKQDTDRTMAPALQYGAPSLITWVPTAISRNEIILPNPGAKHYTENGCAIGGGSVSIYAVSSLGNKLVDKNILFLTNAEGSIGCLIFDRWIPPAVEVEHMISFGQGYAYATCF